MNVFDVDIEIQRTTSGVCVRLLTGAALVVHLEAFDVDEVQEWLCYLLNLTASQALELAPAWCQNPVKILPT